VAEGNRKRHDDHARKRKIEIHEVFILSLLEWGHSEQVESKEKIRLVDCKDRNNRYLPICVCARLWLVSPNLQLQA